MKLMTNPSFWAHFCLQLIVQFRTTTAQIGSLPGQSQLSSHERYLHEAYSHDPFVYSWFNNQPNYILDMLVRESSKDLLFNRAEAAHHEDVEPPEGCYYYTGGQTFPKYLVCDDPHMTEVPHGLPPVLGVLEINQTSIEYIRSKAFEGVTIQILRLNRNKIQDLSSSAFEGVRGLKHLSMNYNFLRIPIWLSSAAGLEHIELIEMDMNRINMDILLQPGNRHIYEQIEAENAMDSDGPYLTNLRYLSVSNNPIGFIPSFFFNRFARSTWFMITIYMTNCNLRDIHPDAFTPFQSIYLLDLSENPGLRNNMVGAATAIAKSNVQKLALAHNGLPRVPTEALSLLERTLTGLDLRGNAFRFLTDESFPYMSNLNALNLDSCRISQISKGAFSNLLNLDTISLRGNSILEIPPALAPLVNLNNLVMSANRKETNAQFIVGENTFANLGQLKTLYLNDLRLNSLNASVFAGLTKLKLLHVKNSQLESLEAEIFKATPNLTFLDLSDNIRLKGINARTFEGLENLDSLNMRSCGLTFPATDDPEFREPFRYLKKLKWLDLNNNRISKLYPELFNTMPYLHSLDLSRNKIQTWTRPVVFANNTLLQELKLSNNHMLTTTDAMLKDFEHVYTNIDLGENPYLCDLGICNLKAAVENKSFYVHEWVTAPDRYMCFLTPNMQVQISSLPVEFCEELNAEEAR